MTMSSTTVLPISTPLTKRSQLLGDIIALSEQMLQAASQEQFHELGESELCRQRLIWDFFEEPLSANEAHSLREQLDYVAEISAELSRISEHHRLDRLNSQADARRRQVGVDAYQRQASR